MRFRGPPSVSVCAPSKLNLYLRVAGKRADGYHELETLMVSVGLYDFLSFSDDPEGQLSLTCHDIRPKSVAVARGELPTGPENLVLRAAELLRQRTGTTRGAKIVLFKRIPLAAGLAGGSTDAAATLAGWNRLWQLGLSSQEMRALAAELGSDIPFFLADSPAAICRGRGEIIETVDIPMSLYFVVARPQTGLSTPAVFKACRPEALAWSATELAAALRAGRLGAAAAYLHNSLQAPAEGLNPEVSQLRRAFERQPVIGHLMSGSGTSYFGLCASRGQARQVAARLRAQRLGDVFIAHSGI